MIQLMVAHTLIVLNDKTLVDNVPKLLIYTELQRYIFQFCHLLKIKCVSSYQFDLSKFVITYSLLLYVCDESIGYCIA